MLLVKSLPIIFDLVLTPQVLYSLEGLFDDLSVITVYIIISILYIELSRPKIMSLLVQ